MRVYLLLQERKFRVQFFILGFFPVLLCPEPALYHRGTGAYRKYQQEQKCIIRVCHRAGASCHHTRELGFALECGVADELAVIGIEYFRVYDQRGYLLGYIQEEYEGSSYRQYIQPPFFAYEETGDKYLCIEIIKKDQEYVVADNGCKLVVADIKIPQPRKEYQVRE